MLSVVFDLRNQNKTRASCTKAAIDKYHLPFRFPIASKPLRKQFQRLGPSGGYRKDRMSICYATAVCASLPVGHCPQFRRRLYASMTARQPIQWPISRTSSQTLQSVHQQRVDPPVFSATPLSEWKLPFARTSYTGSEDR